MLVFVKGGKPEDSKKTPRSKARADNKLNPRKAPGQNAGMVGDKHSHRCAIFASPCGYWVGRLREVPRFSPNKARGRKRSGRVRVHYIFFSWSAVFHSNSTYKAEKRGFERPIGMV